MFSHDRTPRDTRKEDGFFIATPSVDRRYGCLALAPPRQGVCTRRSKSNSCRYLGRAPSALRTRSRNSRACRGQDDEAAWPGCGQPAATRRCFSPGPLRRACVGRDRSSSHVGDVPICAKNSAFSANRAREAEDAPPTPGTPEPARIMVLLDPRGDDRSRPQRRNEHKRLAQKGVTSKEATSGPAV